MNHIIIPINALSQIDTNALNSSVWKYTRFFAKMNINTYMRNEHVFYNVIYVYASNKAKDANYCNKFFRYSELKALRDHIASKYKLEDSLKDFPCKHWWGNRTKDVINERIKGFNEFFAKLNTFMSLDEDPEVCKFFGVDFITCCRY